MKNTKQHSLHDPDWAKERKAQLDAINEYLEKTDIYTIDKDELNRIYKLQIELSEDYLQQYAYMIIEKIIPPSWFVFIDIYEYKPDELKAFNIKIDTLVLVEGADGTARMTVDLLPEGGFYTEVCIDVIFDNDEFFNNQNKAIVTAVHELAHLAELRYLMWKAGRNNRCNPEVIESHGPLFLWAYKIMINRVIKLNNPTQKYIIDDLWENYNYYKKLMKGKKHD